MSFDPYPDHNVLVVWDPVTSKFYSTQWDGVGTTWDAGATKWDSGATTWDDAFPTYWME